MPADLDAPQLATLILKIVGFLCVLGGVGLLLIRVINAWGRLPWSYIGSFVREALVAPLVFIILGCILFGCAKILGTWLSK
ncbi:MAG: hypothetical protein ACPGN3_02320 [Opitutales bacterium]